MPIDLVLDINPTYIDVSPTQRTYVEITRGGYVNGIEGAAGQIDVDLTDPRTPVLSISDEFRSGLFIPRVTTVASATTVTLDCSTTDQYELTALADNVTFAAPLNPIDGLLKLYVYKDNGVSRTITRNAIFVDLVGIAPTSTTANKVGMELVRYSSARSRWEIITVITQP